MPDAGPPAGLVDAATALEEELVRYERLAEGLANVPLGSAKQLRRAAEQLSAIAGAEERMEGALRGLVGAVSAARERQTAAAAAATGRADEIRRRSEELTALLARWEALGAEAGTVHEAARGLLDAMPPENGGGRQAAVDDVARRLQALAADVRTVGDAARAGGFVDLGREADDLRRSLQALANRLRQAAPRAAG